MGTSTIGDGSTNDVHRTPSIGEKQTVVDINDAPVDEAASDCTQIDRTDPLLWPAVRRWSIVILLIATNLITNLFSYAFEPALPQVMQDFLVTSDAISSFTLSIFAFGYVFGPMVFAPLSEYYGRFPVLHGAWALYVVSMAVCGVSKTLAPFIIFRAVMGFAGLGFILMGSAVVADVIPKERRGLALSAMTLGPLCGPTVGAVVGGYTVEAMSWRWIFWIGLIALGATWLAAFAILRETYAPVLQKRLSKEHRQIELQMRSRDGLPASTEDLSLAEAQEREKERQELRAAWLRPLKILFTSPIVILVTLYTSILNAYLQVAYTTVGTVFQQRYGLGPGASGLAYQGLTVGFVVGHLTLGQLADRHARWMAKRHHAAGRSRTGEADAEISIKPEHRLPPIFVGAVCLPLGLLWYGWSLEAGTHWAVPVVGSGFVAVGVLYGYVPFQVYMIDSFTVYAASAFGASTIGRAVAQSLLPLAANPLYDRLGYGWGNSLLAFISVAFIPLGVYLYKCGERIRTSERSQRYVRT